MGKWARAGAGGLAAALAVGCASGGPQGVGRAEAPLALEAGRQAKVQAERLERFRRADLNGDGQLAGAELAAWPPAWSPEGLDDGRLSLGEAVAPGPALAAQVALVAEVEQGAQEELPALPLGQGLGPKPPPVILLPGYLDLHLYFLAIERRLDRAGRAHRYLELFPNVADIPKAAQALGALVRQAQREEGAAQVDLLGHSMGGLIARTYLKQEGNLPSVRRLVTMATPHHGTYVSHLGPGQGADQMHPGSSFLGWLNQPTERPPLPTTSIRAGLDEIVVPHASAILEGADNHEAPLAMHGTILASLAAWRPAAKALGLGPQRSDD